MQNKNRYQQAKIASFINGITNTLLALFKIMTGYFGNSHALIADGLHSFSDLITDALVLLAAKAGGRHPDLEHPYGHQRIETIAAIIIAFVLIGVGASIIYDVWPHLFGHTTTPRPDIPVIIVAIVSIGANEWLFRYTLKVGKRINSNLLITNAWHNRSDAYVSIIVLASVIGAYIGWPYFDAIGAVIVALLIVKMGIQNIWTSLRELIDTGVDPDMLNKIMHSITATPGVESIHQLRTRTHGGSVLVDVHIIVSPTISVSEGHFISEQVHLRLLNLCNTISDVTVHIDPEDDEIYMPSRGLPSRVELEQQLADCWLDLPGYAQIEKIQLHYLNGQLQVEVMLPISAVAELGLHELQQQYQQAVANIPAITQVKLYISE